MHKQHSVPFSPEGGPRSKKRSEPLLTASSQKKLNRKLTSALEDSEKKSRTSSFKKQQRTQRQSVKQSRSGVLDFKAADGMCVKITLPDSSGGKETDDDEHKLTPFQAVYQQSTEPPFPPFTNTQAYLFEDQGNPFSKQLCGAHLQIELLDENMMPDGYKIENEEPSMGEGVRVYPMRYGGGNNPESVTTHASVHNHNEPDLLLDEGMKHCSRTLDFLVFPEM